MDALYSTGNCRTLPANYSMRRRSSSRNQRKASLRRRSSSMTSLLNFDSLHLSVPPAMSAPSSSHEDLRNEEDVARCFRLEELEIGEMIGKGFFGEVYKITHMETGEILVMKRMIRVSDKTVEDRFLKEVSTIRKFDHPNVLKFIGVLYHEKKIALITEYIAGGTLKNWIEEKDKELPWLRRANIACDVAAGMAYLHNRGVVHRDLNSSNILIREDDGCAVVADFGLVQWTGGKRRRCTVVGSPYWMAPEMLREGQYDERVDVFSFGITVCELIGRVSADPDIMPRGTDFGLDTVRFEAEFCQDCPRSFYRLAFRCATVNPCKRPPFTVIHEWLETLVRLLSPAGSPISLTPLFVSNGVEETSNCCPGLVSCNPNGAPYASTESGEVAQSGSFGNNSVFGTPTRSCMPSSFCPPVELMVSGVVDKSTSIFCSPSSSKFGGGLTGGQDRVDTSSSMKTYQKCPVVHSKSSPADSPSRHIVTGEFVDDRTKITGSATAPKYKSKMSKPYWPNGNQLKQTDGNSVVNNNGCLPRSSGDSCDLASSFGQQDSYTSSKNSTENFPYRFRFWPFASLRRKFSQPATNFYNSINNQSTSAAKGDVVVLREKIPAANKQRDVGVLVPASSHASYPVSTKSSVRVVVNVQATTSTEDTPPSKQPVIRPGLSSTSALPDYLPRSSAIANGCDDTTAHLPSLHSQKYSLKPSWSPGTSAFCNPTSYKPPLSPQLRRPSANATPSGKGSTFHSRTPQQSFVGSNHRHSLSFPLSPRHFGGSAGNPANCAEMALTLLNKIENWSPTPQLSTGEELSRDLSTSGKCSQVSSAGTSQLSQLPVSHARAKSQPVAMTVFEPSSIPASSTSSSSTTSATSLILPRPDPLDRESEVKRSISNRKCAAGNDSVDGDELFGFSLTEPTSQMASGEPATCINRKWAPATGLGHESRFAVSSENNCQTNNTTFGIRTIINVNPIDASNCCLPNEIPCSTLLQSTDAKMSSIPLTLAKCKSYYPASRNGFVSIADSSAGVNGVPVIAAECRTTCSPTSCNPVKNGQVLSKKDKLKSIHNRVFSPEKDENDLTIHERTVVNAGHSLAELGVEANQLADRIRKPKSVKNGDLECVRNSPPESPGDCGSIGVHRVVISLSDSKT